MTENPMEKKTLTFLCLSFLKNWMFWLGLLILTAYWYSVHPVGFARGYSEDLCTDIVRQMMAENLQKWGSPRFHFDQFMAPYGVSAPFMSWTLERDWIGAYFWIWNRDFPYLWAYFGFSLLVSYLGVGLILTQILQKVKFSTPVAWALATTVLFFHVPRHYKIWHHFEHLPQHWIYWSLFLDAWIWQRYFRENRWSWNLELWRGVCLLGMTWSTGYFWAPLLFEWLILRTFLGYEVLKRRKASPPLQIEGNLKAAIAPVILGLAMLAITLKWFLPLYHEIKGIGEVPQVLAWFAPFRMFWRPLWAYPVLDFINSIFGMNWQLKTVDYPETVVTVGWLYWVPAVTGLILVRKKLKGPGLMAVWPFLFFLILAVNYASNPNERITAMLMYDYIPFMKYFRVASRWGLFFPQILTIITLLCWPELTRWFSQLKRPKLTAAILIGFSALEIPFMFYPVNMQPPIPDGLERMLLEIAKTPGKSVLSLPFCVAGGNGVCTTEQCPNYPYSITGSCFREWHGKEVYGLYQARMLPETCQIYNRSPFPSWFSAWRDQRCFTDLEWDQFCGYLDDHSEIAALLIFPGVWYGVNTPACRNELEKRLGPPVDDQIFTMSPTRGGKGAHPTEVRWYIPKCRK